jgi:hypothetical protein
MPSIPLLTPQGKESSGNLELSRLGDNLIQLTIAEDFAGRDVEEELSLDILTKVGGEAEYKCFDLIGLAFETDGQEIQGWVGAGSGNTRFVIKKADWKSALDQLTSQ